MKRLRVAQRRYIRNRCLSSRVAASVDAARHAIGMMCKEEAFRALAAMERSIDMAQAKGAMHRNNAARQKRALYALAARAQHNDAKASSCLPT